jgi:hypothetical protein
MIVCLIQNSFFHSRLVVEKGALVAPFSAFMGYTPIFINY